MELLSKYLGGEEVSEVMGYTLKAKDKKIILAFIDGAKNGEGKALFIDGDELRAPMSVVATRKGGKIVPGIAYGNVSQTYLNFLKKNIYPKV